MQCLCGLSLFFFYSEASNILLLVTPLLLPGTSLFLQQVIQILVVAAQNYIASHLSVKMLFHALWI